MGKAALNARILTGRIIKLILLLVLCYGIYWVVANWDFIKHKGTKRYEVERYGHTWFTNLRQARTLAGENNRKVLVAYINSGGSHGPSNEMIVKIFPTKEFGYAINTYVPVLVDQKHDPSLPKGQKTQMEEIIKEYGLQPEMAGMFLLIEPDGGSIRTVSYKNQGPMQLNNELAGGKFVALKPIKAPTIKDPLADKVAETADKAKTAVAGSRQPPEELTEEEKAALAKQSAQTEAPAAEKPAEPAAAE